MWNITCNILCGDGSLVLASGEEGPVPRLGGQEAWVSGSWCDILKEVWMVCLQRGVAVWETELFKRSFFRKGGL